MFRKILTIAAVIAAVVSESPAPHSSAEAVSSQSFTRHDVPLSYKQTSTHPRYIAQTIKSVTAAPVHYAPTQFNYVTQSPQYTYSNPQPSQYSYSTPSSEIQYSTPASQYSTQSVQYSTPSPQYSEVSAQEYSTVAPQYSSPSVQEYTPTQGLHTKVKTPTENGPSEEFTQAYFLPKTTQISGHQQQHSVKTESIPQPQLQYYVMQPQYSTGPVQFQPQVQYQSYQPGQRAPVQYVASYDGHTQAQAQEYVYPQYEQEQVYHVSAPAGGKGQQLVRYESPKHNGYEQLQAPVIAKFSPGLFKPAPSFKSTPIYVQAVPMYSSPVKSTPVYTVAAPTYVKPTLNYAQPAVVATKPVTQYVETTPKSNPIYLKPSLQYNGESAPSYGQTTKLYAIPSNAQTYYTQQY